MVHGVLHPPAPRGHSNSWKHTNQKAKDSAFLHPRLTPRPWSWPAEHKEERTKEKEFYQRHKGRNASKITENPNAKTKISRPYFVLSFQSIMVLPTRRIFQLIAALCLLLLSAPVHASEYNSNDGYEDFGQDNLYHDYAMKQQEKEAAVGG